MLFTKSLVTAICMMSFSNVFAMDLPKLQKTNFQSWDGVGVQQFGCFLEKEFSIKDKKFNCSLKKYENKGDACKNTKAYYEGPQIPADKAKLVDERFESIELAWEHGDLQNITVTLNKKYKEKELRQSLKLNEKSDIQDCSLKNTCIVYDVFDHMGAGDLDCGESESSN